MDRALLLACGGVLVLLVVATVIGQILRVARPPSATIHNLNQRIYAWWIMCLVFGLTLVIGPIGSLVLFGFLSLLALREYVTLIETRRADHRTLFWTFFAFTPLQYFLLGIKWTGFFIVIPVYAFLFIPAMMAIAGDTRAFLERASKIQWGLMICVYCLSYAPALLILTIHNGYGPDAKLLFFLVLVCQLSDVLQYVYGKLLGKHKIAPDVSPSKTWEGFIGGTITATAIGTALWWMTPFSPGAAAAIAFGITLMGFAGGLVMSAIKRDRGVKDFGNLIQGHGGILDRMDSMIFAAPVFFHVVRFFYGL